MYVHNNLMLDQSALRNMAYMQSVLFLLSSVHFVQKALGKQTHWTFLF